MFPLVGLTANTVAFTKLYLSLVNDSLRLANSDMAYTLEKVLYNFLGDVSTGDCWIELTANTVAFTKLYLSLVNDGLRLANSDMAYTLDKVLYDVLSAQFKHLLSSYKSDKLSQQRPLIIKNAAFILDSLVPICEKSFLKHLNTPSHQLPLIVKEYSPKFKESGTNVTNVIGYV